MENEAHARRILMFSMTALLRSIKNCPCLIHIKHVKQSRIITSEFIVKFIFQLTVSGRTGILGADVTSNVVMAPRCATEAASSSPLVPLMGQSVRGPATTPRLVMKHHVQVDIVIIKTIIYCIHVYWAVLTLCSGLICCRIMCCVVE